ncbi:MAG: energy-coupling factor transporter transmembrane component T [bacterium]|nr:energy-coupling factor transporter transmembrane component T [bacterium]
MSFSNIALGNYYPARSPIHSLDPRFKIVALAGLMMATFLIDCPGGVGLHSAAIAAAIVLSGVPVPVFLRGLRVFAILFLFTAVLHLFFTPGTPVLEITAPVTISITSEGITRGLLISWRLITVIALSSLLTYTTTPLSITRGLEAMLTPLKRVKFPVQDFSLMMMIAIRFIPVLTGETERVWKAQRSRGADPGRGGLRARSRVLMSVILPVFIGLFRRADELALALEARGYRPGMERTAMYPLSWRGRDFAATVIIVLWAAGVLLLTRG